MMSGVPLETCWAFKKLWNNKFYYKAASCWYFYWEIEKDGSQSGRWLKTALDHYTVWTFVNGVVQRGTTTCHITMYSLINIYSAESGGCNVCLTARTTMIYNVVLCRVIVVACTVRKVIQTAHLSDIFQELEVIKGNMNGIWQLRP
jgi:hypothetical protein